MAAIEFGVFYDISGIHRYLPTIRLTMYSGRRLVSS